MTAPLWLEQVAAISPLLRLAPAGKSGTEISILQKVFSLVPTQASFYVEVGGQPPASSMLATVASSLGWRGLHLQHAPDCAPQVEQGAPEIVITAAHANIYATGLNALFAKYGVPEHLDCLLIGGGVQAHCALEGLDLRFKPTLVILEFNPHVAFDVEASVTPGSDSGGKDYGASFAALYSLATRRGYTLVHVHGPRHLYFVRTGSSFPAELSVNSPLNAAQFTLLTDTESFCSVFEEHEQRPAWVGSPAPDVANAPWELLAAPCAAKTVDLEGLTIEVLADKQDANWYLQRKTFEEKASFLYRFICDEGFANFVDVGANVGFVSLLAGRACAGLNIIALEADPRLARLIRRNFQQHGLTNARVVNAVVGSHALPSVGFSLNPSSTLDNRVRVEKWAQIRVPMVRLDEQIKRLGVRGKTFFKIDTQGFELHVLQGLEPWLMNTTKWALKMEFAPEWLSSQGTEPAALLDYLQLRYEFVEYPERITFGTSGLDALFETPIKFRQHSEFLNHVTAQNRNRMGWVDLLVRPKAA